MPAEYGVCVNCCHPIYGYRVNGVVPRWKHFRKKEGQRHGTGRTKCWECDCNEPIPREGGF